MGATNGVLPLEEEEEAAAAFINPLMRSETPVAPGSGVPDDGCV